MSVQLNEKAMLTRLSISQWIACKCDRKISDKIAKDYDAEMNSGRYNKMLVSMKEIKSVSKISNSARNFHYKNSLPWGEDGSRLLPSANFEEYSKKMREFKNNFEESVNEIISQYQTIKDSAKTRLANMFDENDYPSIDILKSKYGFNIFINPLPSSEDFRVSLQENEINIIKTNIKNRLEQSKNKAMLDLWQRLFDNVSHMANKLNNEDSLFRDSLVNNLIDICSLLPKLNITNDLKLEKMRQEVEIKLCNCNPNNLRTNEHERRKVGNNAKDILNDIDNFITNSSYKKDPVIKNISIFEALNYQNDKIS